MTLNFPGSPVNGQIYQGYIYDSALGVWNLVPVDSAQGIDQLAGVDISSPVVGQALVFDGTDWVNSDSFAPRLLAETTTQTTNYTLTLSDLNKVVSLNGTSLIVTVPTNASVPFPIGSVVNVYNLAATDATITGASGVTVRNAGEIAQFSEASLRKRGTDEWVMVGG
jgi:hypothetical protein